MPEVPHPSLLPEHTKAHLHDTDGPWSLPGNDEVPCIGASFHSPRPLFTAQTPLVLPDWSGDLDDAPVASLCGTCRDNLSLLLQMLHHGEGDLDWAVRREFGNKIRALAVRGWQWYAEHREKHHQTT